MLNKVLEGECAVCFQPIPKDRIHYGGISCYSCRAFFRRNTQRDELPLCKSEGNCRITYADRKQCSACRYASCLRIGMKPELVLTEDDKKRRFKKFLKKKEAEHQTHSYRDEDQSPGWENDSDSPPPLRPLSPKYSNLMTSSFQNNLQLLLSRQGSIFQQNFLADKCREDVWSTEEDLEIKPEVIPPPLSPTKPMILPPLLTQTSPKDNEALKYFTSRGLFQPTFSPTLISPDRSRHFTVNPRNQAQLFERHSPLPLIRQEIFHNIHEEVVKPTERKSVITFPTSLKIKSEDFLYESSSNASNPHYCDPVEQEDEPQNLSLKRVASEDAEDNDNNEQSATKYVHKKFRTCVDKEDEQNIYEAPPLPARQSVIMHARNVAL